CGVGDAADRKLPRQRRASADQSRPRISRRRAALCQQVVTARQVRRRICLTLVHLRRHGDHPLQLVSWLRRKEDQRWFGSDPRRSDSVIRLYRLNVRFARKAAVERTFGEQIQESSYQNQWNALAKSKPSPPITISLSAISDLLLSPRHSLR